MTKQSTIRVKIRGAWTAIPNKLLLDSRLSRDARLCGALIFLHAGNAERTFPSQEQLAKELSTSERVITVRSVQRWLTELRATGWMAWKRTTKNNEYTLLNPNDPDDDDESTLTKAIPVSCPDTTQGSPWATQGSCPDTTQGSPWATQGSCPTFIKEDSLDLDSTNTDSSSSRGDADADNAVVVFLSDLGVSAAQEFAHLDLAAVEERVRRIQRDPNWQPGAITLSLRKFPPKPRIAERQRAPLISSEQARARAEQIAPDATEEEITLLALDIEAGATDDQVRHALDEQRWRAEHLPAPQQQRRTRMVSK